jgi:hypothetical protein
MNAQDVYDLYGQVIFEKTAAALAADYGVDRLPPGYAEALMEKEAVFTAIGKGVQGVTQALARSSSKFGKEMGSRFTTGKRLVDGGTTRGDTALRVGQGLGNAAKWMGRHQAGVGMGVVGAGIGTAGLGAGLAVRR